MKRSDGQIHRGTEGRDTPTHGRGRRSQVQARRYRWIGHRHLDVRCRADQRRVLRALRFQERPDRHRC